ncbi:hypothetical protein [Amycolatopsis sp. DG1A-15b]|uniref:hypothetical protein n=1 Tax=Amycolatopsis sp. DG1A-15b TaxID=3052846 RepID=UPI00255B698E|nr:hypothetical protein [Amycolatopsis sp. DG1A-15b]WIX85570.1 hypothetical protein QRY02_30635 [Amycolatopsis sp. DG1A-15b]
MTTRLPRRPVPAGLRTIAESPHGLTATGEAATPAWEPRTHQPPHPSDRTRPRDRRADACEPSPGGGYRVHATLVVRP